MRTEWRLHMMTHNLTKLSKPPNRRPGGLKRPHVVTAPSHNGHVTNGLPTSERSRLDRQAFEKQPPSVAAASVR